jgi:diguanylate cyclase (GGDEF)-like protein
VDPYPAPKVSATDPAHSSTRSRFDPMSGSWPMIVLDVVWVTGVTLACWAVVNQLFDTPVSRALAYGIVTSVVILVFTALPLRYFLLRERADTTVRERLLSEESERRQFEARLVRALDMTTDTTAAVDVAVEAIGLLSPNACGEVLLADSSRAHMQRVGGNEPEGCSTRCRCEVATPHGCPAVRSGHAIRYEDSRLLDACPQLRQRGEDISALCVPVSVAGATTGVVHLVRPAGQPFAEREVAGITTVAEMTGSRISLVTAMAQSQLQASTDPLTGLLNRRSLENEVRQLIQHGERLAVVIADLDHFKVLNDTFGHDAGDRALRMFARVLRHTVRDGDLVCRYGGEEFIVVCPNADTHTAELVFDRVRMELEASLVDGRNPSFTVSAGIADSGDAKDFTDMITLADIALMQAKSDGRNRTVLAQQVTRRDVQPVI